MILSYEDEIASELGITEETFVGTIEVIGRRLNICPYVIDLRNLRKIIRKASKLGYTVALPRAVLGNSKVLRIKGFLSNEQVEQVFTFCL